MAVGRSFRRADLRGGRTLENREIYSRSTLNESIREYMPIVLLSTAETGTEIDILQCA